MTVRSNFGFYNSGTYTPFICEITAISQASQAVITTSVNHGFVIGNQVQLFIPPQNGMSQINGMKGVVVGNTNNTITITINSTNFDAFQVTTPVLPVVYDIPLVSPIGDYNTGYQIQNAVPPEPLAIPGANINTYP